MPIKFYGVSGEYGEFSNFSAHPFHLDGKRWPTSEHYFQAQKFEDAEYREEIRTAKSPMIAARLGRSRKMKLRREWESAKDAVMRKAVLAKFEAHLELQDLLLGTGEEMIIENAPGDFYWGCGADGSGKNRLGQILVDVRKILRDAKSNEKASS